MQRGHNWVFKPYFRSDLYAEMDTLTRYEDERLEKERTDLLPNPAIPY
jgi:hypothetical protein